jgi:hypothetical protein
LRVGKNHQNRYKILFFGSKFKCIFHQKSLINCIEVAAMMAPTTTPPLLLVPTLAMELIPTLATELIPTARLRVEEKFRRNLLFSGEPRDARKNQCI